MLPQATADHYQDQQQLAVTTVQAARRAWAGMSVNIDGSWPAVLDRLVVLTVAAQVASARQGAAYVPAVLAETGQTDVPVAQVTPRAFAGTAADGRPLDTFLFTALTTTRTALGRGVGIPDALAQGGRWLDMAVSTTVADVGRQAASTAIAARPAVAGWVRMVNIPSCSRCVLLAGRFYRWNRGFERHPGCDCRHIPSSEALATDLRLNPKALIAAGQVTGISRADHQAIADGADPGQVINAHRGMTVADAYGRKVHATTEGTARGVAKRVLTAHGGSYTRTPRLRPEAIYRLANGNRDEAIRLLERFGYLT